MIRGCRTCKECPAYNQFKDKILLGYCDLFEQRVCSFMLECTGRSAMEGIPPHPWWAQHAIDNYNKAIEILGATP